MSNRPPEDEPDDRMSANPEDARLELGYERTARPPLIAPPAKRDGPGHWGTVWIPGEAPPLATTEPRLPQTPDRDGNVKCDSPYCKGHKPGTVMFARPGAVIASRESLTWCGPCVGEHNRRNVERTRACIVSMKAAAAGKDDSRWIEELKQLEELVGRHQAQETAKAIRARLEQAPAKGSGR